MPTPNPHNPTIKSPSPPHAAATIDAPGTVTARFNPLYRPYLVVTIGFFMACTIIGIPLAIIWFCGVGPWWAHHYFDKLMCSIDGKALRFRKGILVQVEKTIPLENIQDVTFIEGPILKKFHLATLKFETAGHSSGQAHDMHLTGIIDAHEFRNRIIEARESLRQQHHGGAPPAAAAPGAPNNNAHLALLSRISAQLDEVTALLRKQG